MKIPIDPLSIITGGALKPKPTGNIRNLSNVSKTAGGGKAIPGLSTDSFLFTPHCGRGGKILELKNGLILGPNVLTSAGAKRAQLQNPAIHSWLAIAEKVPNKQHCQ